MPEFPNVAVFFGAGMSTTTAEQVVHAVGQVLARRGIVGGARVRLSTANCLDEPMVVQVNLRIRDTCVRVQTLTHGGDLKPALVRLDRQIGSVLQPWRPQPWPDRTCRALTGIDRAAITRRKTYPLLYGTPLQAVEVMDAMDYDVYLFTDAETEEDAVVYRGGPTGVRLARQHRMHPPQSVDASDEPVSLTVHPHATPTLTEVAAVNRLCDHGLPFLFFTDPSGGRGRLLYRRYDANLGVITPANAHRDDVS